MKKEAEKRIHCEPDVPPPCKKTIKRIKITRYAVGTRYKMTVPQGNLAVCLTAVQVASLRYSPTGSVIELRISAKMLS